MRRVADIVLPFLFVGMFVCIISCCTEDLPREEPIEVCIESFSFRVQNNPSLTNDIVVLSPSDTIDIYIENLAKTDSLVASLTGKFEYIEVRGAKIISGETALNYNKVIKYDLYGQKEKKSYFVIVKGGTGLPKIEINTVNSVDIISKTEYIPTVLKISNSPEYGKLEEDAKIRGRGNATWDNFPKKPYMVKFDSKQSVFGYPQNKKWVLLPDYVDRSVMRTAYMCEVSKAFDIDYTINYKYVDVYLNGDYRGLYLLTDHVEKGKNRVNIEDDGFLIENDYYYNYEPLYFTTEVFKNNYTFKYPDANDGDIVKDDENYKYINDYLNNLEIALQKLENDIYDTSYEKWIDTESFAKWYICANIIAIEDPNVYYVMRHKGDKLKMMPMWDAEWSLGTWSNSWPDERPEPLVESQIWTQPYFSHLILSPVFVATVREIWAKNKHRIDDIKYKTKSVRKEISNAAHKNFSLWKEPNWRLNVYFSTWEEEIDYVEDFFDKRIIWFDNYINTL